MSKCKLTVSNVEKFTVACALANVAIVEQVNYGEITQVVINFKQPVQLIELGQYLIKDIKAPEIKVSEPKPEVKTDAKKQATGTKK